MINKKGFTLVEILATIAILAVLATAAGLGITSSINKQKQKLAYQAEENIAEAAKSYASNKINNYLQPCVNSDGAFVTITEKKVNAMNKALRESEGIASSNEDLLYQNMKIYSNYANTRDEEKAFLNNYIKVGNKTCFKTVTVGELVEQGYIKDDDHMCNKASIIVLYRRADAKNTAGIMDTVQERGICNSKRSSSSGPVITITPFSNLAYSTSKSIKITIHSDSTTLKNPLTLNYNFTTSDKKGPSSYTKSVILTRTSDDELSGTISMNNDVDKTLYLWIKSGTIMDNKNNKTSTIVTGPYAFSPIVLVTYNKTADGVTGCDEKKTVVFEEQYGKNANNMSAPLCIPEKTGYNFVGWTYQGTKTKITNTSIVKMKLDHYLSDNWEPKVYNVSLDKNGATNTPTSSIKVTYDSTNLNPSTIILPKQRIILTGFRSNYFGDRNASSVDVLVNGRRPDNTISETMECSSTFNGWTTTKNGSTILLSSIATPALQPNISNYTNASGLWIKPANTTTYASFADDCRITLPTITRAGYTCGWGLHIHSDGAHIVRSENIKASGSTINPVVETNARYKNNASADYDIISVLATCDACKYNIAFNKNNASATGTMSDKECTYDKDCKLTNNAYSLSGYSFNGWNTKTDRSGVNYSNGETVKNLTSTCNGNFNLYANWCQNCASVSHGSCSLDVGTAGVCKYTTSCDTGYHYSSGASTRNPVCTVNTYTIVYNGNYNDHGSMADTSCTYGTKCKLRSNAFTRYGYTFVKWNTKADGSGTSYNNGVEVLNLTAADGGKVNLYAIWHENIWAIDSPEGGADTLQDALNKAYAGANLKLMRTYNDTYDNEMDTVRNVNINLNGKTAKLLWRLKIHHNVNIVGAGGVYKSKHTCFSFDGGSSSIVGGTYITEGDTSHVVMIDTGAHLTVKNSIFTTSTVKGHSTILMDGGRAVIDNTRVSSTSSDPSCLTLRGDGQILFKGSSTCEATNGQAMFVRMTANGFLHILSGVRVTASNKHSAVGFTNTSVGTFCLSPGAILTGKEKYSLNGANVSVPGVGSKACKDNGGY